MVIINAPYDESSPRAEESLLAVLAGAARRKSDGALAVWAGAGALAAVVIGVALPGWWALLMLAIGASAFGAWGIVDRELADGARTEPGRPVRSVGRERSLRVARTVIAVVGFGAGLVALLMVFAGALGTWIS